MMTFEYRLAGSGIARRWPAQGEEEANDSAPLPSAGSLVQPERDNQISRRNGNQLLAIGCVADR